MNSLNFILTSLLSASILCISLCAAASEPQWSPFSQRLPGKLSGPAVTSDPIQLGNPLLEKIKEKLYELPWAPGEAVLIRSRGRTGLTAFGFWNGPREYQMMVRQGKKWQVVTPTTSANAAKPQLAYFGHEVSGQSPAWSGPARIVVVGPAGAGGIEVLRVPIFEAGCTLMVLERGERELRQAREFLGRMSPAPAGLLREVDECQARIDAAREQLRSKTLGLLDIYQALPEPRYALENIAFFSRLYQRGKSFETIGDPEIWTRALYGRPEFDPCVAVRKAVQEAFWDQRPDTLAVETAEVFGQEADFGASITHGLVKFRKDKAFPEPLKTSYRLSVAGDEYESFQVAIAGIGKPLKNVSVKVDWEGQGPHPEVTLRPVGYVETKPDPDNLAEYIGWWPDPLMPPGPTEVAAYGTQPVWGTVHATRNTRRGYHKAVVTVEAEGCKPLKLHLTAHVLDFNIGFTHLPGLLALSLDSIKKFYKLETVPQEVKRRWYDFCLQYRMNPNNIYTEDFIPEEEDIDFCVQRGFNAMVITTPPISSKGRSTPDNLQVWVSDDNQKYTRVTSVYSVESGSGGQLVVSGLDVRARYLKVHSTFTDDSYTFVLKKLVPGRVLAYDGEQSYTGPAGYVGADNGEKPLTSFGADWGAALDYRETSLGVDLGQPRHVTKIVLSNGEGDLLERVKRFYEVAKAHGLGDRAYVYGFDEWADVKRYGAIKETYDALKAVAPGIKASSTVVHPVPPVDKTIDAWCPCLCYEYPEYKQARKRGQEIWYYEGGCPYDPYPTHELLDVPAVEARAFFWIAWRYQYTGWLHWELNVWLNNMDGDKRWPEVPWDPARSGVRNGEVGRIYPGPNVTPLPSVRLENMRDGIEDYDYMWLLREKARKLPAGDKRRVEAEKLIDSTIKALCQSRGHFERDPDRVLAAHEKLGKAIEKLSR